MVWQGEISLLVSIVAHVLIIHILTVVGYSQVVEYLRVVHQDFVHQDEGTWSINSDRLIEAGVFADGDPTSHDEVCLATAAATTLDPSIVKEGFVAQRDYNPVHERTVTSIECVLVQAQEL